MRETEFRRLLSGRLGERSIDSYVAYCRRVERDLGVDLDACDLSEAGLAAMGSRLRAAGVRDKSLSNCMSGLRAYADLAGAASTARAKAGRMTITPEQRESWAANTASGPFNHWLDAQVKDDDGRMNLDRLHALAGQFGVDRRREYEHLNPGQQRMNLGNILRRLVPEALYAAQEAPPAPVEISPDRPTETSTQNQPRRSSIHQATVGELLALYGEIMDELRGRGVVRTGNSPVGDYAELLFATALRIPRDRGHEFHGKVGADSTRRWARIPRDHGRPLI